MRAARERITEFFWVSLESERVIGAVVGRPVGRDSSGELLDQDPRSSRFDLTIIFRDLTIDLKASVDIKLLGVFVTGLDVDVSGRDRWDLDRGGG